MSSSEADEGGFFAPSQRCDDMVDLAVALHRKLLNINSDIRLIRKRKFVYKPDLDELVRKRKTIDAALSGTKKLIIRHKAGDDCTTLYTQYLNVYKST